MVGNSKPFIDGLARSICSAADKKFAEADDQNGRLCMVYSLSDEVDKSELAKAIYARGYGVSITRQPTEYKVMYSSESPNYYVKLTKRNRE